MSHTEPDFTYTEKEAIDDGAARSMDGYGIAWFRGEPIRTVSEGLFQALKDAYGLAASAGCQSDARHGLCGDPEGYPRHGRDHDLGCAAQCSR